MHLSSSSGGRRYGEAMRESATAAPHIDEFPALRPGWTPRLVACDVDGTLLTTTHRLQPETIAAVARVRARGTEVLLTTSRGPSVLWPVLREMGLTDPASFIGSQGGVTGRYTDAGDLVVLDRHPMPLGLVRPVVDDALRSGIAVSWYAGGDWFVSHVDSTIENEEAIVGVRAIVRDLSAEVAGPEKLMLIAPTPDVEPLRDIAARLPAGLRAQISNPTYLEITRADVDKAEATRLYCARHGIDLTEVVAIGDGPNDLGLFALAAVTVAPASARPEVLAAADFRTSGNDEGAVARALEALVP